MRRSWACLVMACLQTAAALASPYDAKARLAAAEVTFLDFMDASNAVGLIDSGYAPTFGGRDRDAWQRMQRERRAGLDSALAAIDPATLTAADAAALAAIRQSVQLLDSLVPNDATGRKCADASRRDLDYASLRAALVSCFIEIGNRLEFEGGTIDRLQARTLLAETDEPARRRALFTALQPLWTAINGNGDPGSPYRRMIAMAAADRAQQPSEIDRAARAIGVSVPELDRWLVSILEAWSRAVGTREVEPWDFTYEASAGEREMRGLVPPAGMAALNERFYRDLGADLPQLGILFDLAPRADKSSISYTDFVRRGRESDGKWSRPVPRIVATLRRGGLGELNELVHETGHAVHVSAIHARPAYMDWPDSLFAEAFADVPAASVYEPAWQRRYLGKALPESASLRALYGNVVLDVAWSLFELRMLQAPRSDPNVVWTDITHRYLHVKPHPELPWWALRVQLVEWPGYMVNYGLGAVLTAEMRARAAAAIGPFDSGNARWYPWLAEHLLRYGSERDTRRLMTGLLGRPVSPDALLAQIRRIGSGAR